VKCFFHHDVEAIGVCSHCHRALCAREGCARYQDQHLFCRNHNIKTFNLEFSRRYIEAIEFAREAGLRGVRTTELLKDLEEKILAESGA